MNRQEQRDIHEACIHGAKQRAAVFGAAVEADPHLHVDVAISSQRIFFSKSIAHLPKCFVMRCAKGEKGEQCGLSNTKQVKEFQGASR